MNSRKNLLWVVCHPDDEVAWCGGTLRAFSELDEFNNYVVCLSGGDAASPRKNEFANVMAIVGVKKWWINEIPLRDTQAPLPETSAILVNALGALGLGISEVDLLVTHSPYGDEHLNPHHRQAFLELAQFSELKDIPFSFFSGFSIPGILLNPMLQTPIRIGDLHLVNFCRCRPSPKSFFPGWRSRFLFEYLREPAYWVQFLTSYGKKKELIDCYPSIDIPMHLKGYTSFTHALESLYFWDERGVQVIKPIFNIGRIHPHLDLFPQKKSCFEGFFDRCVQRFLG